MATKEYRTFTGYNLNSSVLSLGFDLIERIVVPRNQKAQIVQSEISLISASSAASSTNITIIGFLAPILKDITGAANSNAVWDSFEPILHLTQCGTVGAGSPVNFVGIAATSQSHRDFRDDQRRGLSVRSKGVRSNQLNGWAFYMANPDGTDYAANMFSSLDVEFEWLGGHGSLGKRDIADQAIEAQGAEP